MRQSEAPTLRSDHDLAAVGRQLERGEASGFALGESLWPARTFRRDAPDGGALGVVLGVQDRAAVGTPAHSAGRLGQIDKPHRLGQRAILRSRALGSVNPPRSLAVLRASDLVLLEEPDIFIPRPHALAVDTVSGRVYSGSLSTNQIAMLDFAAGDVQLTDVPGPPQAFVGLAVSPDGRTLVATTQLSGRLLVFATGAGLTPAASVAVEALPTTSRSVPTAPMSGSRTSGRAR